MEEFVVDTAAALVAAAPAAGAVVLQAVIDQDEFTAAYPDARTLRESVAYPLTLQHVRCRPCRGRTEPSRTATSRFTSATGAPT